MSVRPQITKLILTWVIAILTSCSGDGPRPGYLRGEVRGVPGNAPLENARVTLADRNGRFMAETRTDQRGRFEFAAVGGSAATVGAAALGREYSERVVEGSGHADVLFQLGVETHPGRWRVVGDTEPERPAGTPSGTLMPDGNILFCHDTQDAVLFDPRTGAKSMAQASPSSQGCHMSSVLADGRVIFVGGQASEEPAAFTQAIKIVKLYDPVTNTWEVLPELNEERWYPSLMRLADGKLLVCGGGQRPDASRTATCEIFDPVTGLWTRTGSIALPTEYSPSVLLLTGDVLTTWWPPQLFDPSTGQWRLTGNFIQQDRGFPDHADHSLLLLPGGDALAIGYEGSAGTSMVERYDPISGTWSTRSSPTTVRSQSEVVLLPDGRVLAAGGTLEQGNAETNAFGEVAGADLYDPETDAWRAMAPMALAREYHALTLLVPDGRVITTSGTGNQASAPAPEASVEAFEPPYLFRGFRPVIDYVDSVDLTRDQSIAIGFSQTSRPTGVVLIGTGATTHWMDGGVPRLLRLDFDVEDGVALATVPDSAVEAPSGYYILFLMVDDIPSVGRIVRIR